MCFEAQSYEKAWVGGTWFVREAWTSTEHLTKSFMSISHLEKILARFFSKKFEKPWRPVAGQSKKGWPATGRRGFSDFFWKNVPKLIRIQFFEKPFCQISKDYHFLSFPIKFEFFDYLHHSKLSFLWTFGRPLSGAKKQSLTLLWWKHILCSSNDFLNAWEWCFGCFRPTVLPTLSTMLF